VLIVLKFLCGDILVWYYLNSLPCILLSLFNKALKKDG
jgi:hypothetical protein